MVTISTIKLVNPVSPALPVAPDLYARKYHDQHNNVLRLYFSQLDGTFSALFGEAGGRFLSLPCGSFFSNVAQTASANVATVMTLNNTDSNATIATSLSNGSILVTYAGIYNYQFSAQFFNTDSQAHDVDVWLRVNGVDSYESATQLTIPSKHGSTNGAAVAAWNFLAAAPANSVIDLVWATYDASVSLGYAPAQTSPFVRPSIPSLISTVTFVSALQSV